MFRVGCPKPAAWPVGKGDVRFSNRPFRVKHFQTIRCCSVDVAHGLALLFGIGTKALVWSFRCQGVCQAANLCPSSFFCSISKTVSSPPPPFALVDAQSRLAVAPTLRRAPPLSGHTLTASRATARLRGRDNDQRGARYRARFNRATTLYPVGPRTRTMMQSCASAAKLRSGGPILPVGMKAKGLVGVPPPRTVIGAPSQACGQGRNYRDAFNVLRLLCRTHNDAVRDNTLSHEPPQGDQKLACQGHDHGLSSTASVLGAGSKPFRQGAVLLV